MTEDIVKRLGYLTLGTRLKRLGERLQSQTQILLEEAAISFPASYFPFLAALDTLGPLSVGQLTEAIGVSQPAVTHVLMKLADEGLVRSRKDADDHRVRTVSLSRAGRRLISRAKRAAWAVIAAAVADACEGPASSLLGQLTALEEALTAAPLNVRARRVRMQGRGANVQP